MVAAASPKKVRIKGPNGKFQWVFPEELDAQRTSSEIPQSVQRQAVADLSAGELYDWDGNEVEQLDETYDEYVNKMPSKTELKRYAKPVGYWEVRYPGCALQPFPRMGAILSTPSGLWQAHNAVQERAIREHIALSTHLDPDDLQISDDEMAVMAGKQLGEIQYCQNAGCFFVTCAARAAKAHAMTNGHRLDYRPRKD